MPSPSATRRTGTALCGEHQEEAHEQKEEEEEEEEEEMES